MSDPIAGLGAAQTSRATWQVAPGTGQLFQYKAHPTITAVSASALGLGGASSLTITGSGFSWTPTENVVSLAGVPCAVTASTLTSITCAPGAAAAPTNLTTGLAIAYPLGRGLLHSYAPFTGTGAGYLTPTTALPVTATQWVNTDAVKSYCTNCGTYFVEDLRGLFIPPVTANYSFWVRGDDAAYVWLSSSASPAGARLIASSPTYTTAFYGAASQISAPLSLVAGRPYYFQARHLQYSSWTDFFVGLRIHTTGNAAAAAALASENQRVYDSVSEVQAITAAAASPVRALLSFYVVGVTASSTFALVAGSTTVCPNCAGGVFFAANTSTADISLALRGYLGCLNFGVTRAPFANARGAGFAWNVSINCPLAAAPPAFVPRPIVFTAASAAVSPDVGGSLLVAPSAPVGGTALFWYNASVGDPDATPLTLALANPSSVAASLYSQLLAQPGIEDVAVDVGTWACNAAKGAAFACDSLSWIVTFVAPYGDVPLLAADASAVTGARPTATATTLIQGSTDVFLMPAPMDYFQVRVGGGGGKGRRPWTTFRCVHVTS